MTFRTNPGRWAILGVVVVASGALGIQRIHAARSASPADDAALVARAVTESVARAESRGAGSDHVEGLPAAPRGLGAMTARAPGTSDVVTGVRLASHKVNVVIQDGLARTEVEETFENTTARVLEGRYVFPIPPDASISRLALYVGKELVEGEVVARERAARIFKGIVDDTVRPRDPALLEWVTGSEVSLKVFPLPARGARTIVLAYDQVLPEASRRVRYVYPLSLGPDRAITVDELAIDVTASDATTSLTAVRTPGYAATTTPSGPLHVAYSARAFTPAADFVLEYERAPATGPDASAYPATPSAATPIGAAAPAEDGYLLMRLPVRAPIDAGAGVRPDRAVVLDASQSQSRETLAGEIAIARGVLRRLDVGERFALLACDSACAAYPDDGLAVASVSTLDDAERWLAARSPGGSSDLAGALEAAASRVGSSSAAQVVYLGDGTPSAGELSVETIAARVRPEMQARKIDLRLFGAGRTVDEGVLGGLARALGAAYERVSTGEPLARRIDAIALGLDRPLLVDPALEVPAFVYDVHPRTLPHLHAGQELLVTARVRRGEQGSIKLKGTLGGVAYADEKAILWATAPAPVPPRLWASAKITDLESSTDASAREEAIALSRIHHVMSRSASFLVLESDRMFAEFGIERAGTKSGGARVTRPELRIDALSSGIIGLLDGSARGMESVDPSKANQWGSGLDAVMDPGGLRLSGMGEGGSGAGVGFGSGHGWLSGEHRVSSPAVRTGTVTVSGGLPREVVQRIARQNYGRFRLCYEHGLRNNPELAGRVTVRFVIGLDGGVASVANGGSDLPDGGVVACIVRSFAGLSFPAPDGGSITVSYPMLFSPGGESTSPPRAVAPSVPSAVHRAGDARWMSEGEDALAKLRGALRADEASRQRHEALIRGLLARGRFPEALIAAGRYSDLDPDSPSARELLAQAAAANGDGPLARTALDAELEGDPSSPDRHSRAARAFEAAGDERRACAHFRSLLDLRPGEDDARFEALRCRARLGEHDAVLAEIAALSRPGKRVVELAATLAAGPARAYEPGAGARGDLEATVSCVGESERCPTVLLLAPNGKVVSPWTPSVRGGLVSFGSVGAGTYRTLLVGGDPEAACEVTVRALGATKKFTVAPAGSSTIATTTVTIPEVSFGGR